jgi:GAF domain-containing protein
MVKEIQYFPTDLLPSNGNGDLRNALGHLVQLAAESAGATFGSFYLADYRSNVLKPYLTYGLPAEYVAACGDVGIGDQCCGRAVFHREPWVVADMLTDPLFVSAREAAMVSPIRAAFSVPVIDDAGDCLGSLGCHYCEPHTATHEQISRNEIWASMIAHTIGEYKNGRARQDGMARSA